MPLSDFQYIMRFRVPFCDIDMMQHVNHAAYVVWAETARSAYFEEVIGEPLSGTNGIILARLEFDYERPIDYREQVAIGCRVGRMGRKSFDFNYEMWNESRQERAVRAVTTMVAYNYETKSSQPIPERWRELILSYETTAPVTDK